MNDLSTFLMMTTAIAIGWLLGTFQRLPNWTSTKNIEPYGSQFLVSEVPDHALDSFLAALDVNSDTLETHLALGAIYRRKGETERAIRIHENLLNKTGLTEAQLELAEFELAMDYKKAGLIDRAEKYLQRLAETSRNYRRPSLGSLLDIYQASKEWRKAVNVSNLITEDSSDQVLRAEMNRLRSHFYCELAIISMGEDDFLGAKKTLERAEQYSIQNSRSGMLRVELDLMLNRPSKAISNLKILVERAETFPDALPALLEKMTERLSGQKAYLELLQFCFSKFPAPEMVRLIFSELAAVEDQDSAVQFLLKELSQHPTATGLKEALANDAYSSENHSLVEVLKAIMNREQEALRLFRCDSCGFNGHQWHWQCPTCHRWDSMSYLSESGLLTSNSLN